MSFKRACSNSDLGEKCGGIGEGNVGGGSGIGSMDITAPQLSGRSPIPAQGLSAFGFAVVHAPEKQCRLQTHASSLSLCVCKLCSYTFYSTWKS